ncbi:hypothetical protein ACIQWL_44360 [Streptomyces mirabilis]|uniref:hypothetical protein n=1 Tax=Streptomyces mirabilis TaxID=68239 RepID=UPI0038138474
MDVATQVSAFVGVVIGGTLSFVSTAVSERARWKRDLKREWTQRRFDAYRELLHVAHIQVGAARSLATTRNLLDGPPPVSVSEGIKEIADSDRRLALAYETVQMLGDADVAAAAHAWRAAIWQLSDYARGAIEADAAEWERTYMKYRETRDAFHAAVRRDLDIAGLPYQRNVTSPSSRRSNRRPTP